MARRERCPKCGSYNITGRGYDTADGDELQERYCYDCKHDEGRLRSEGGVGWWTNAPAQLPHRLHTATGLERTLLDEIYAAPDDDGVRSIYADWLIEQGDPLGQFITLQLARVARKESVASEEEQRLVDEHWSRWIGEPTSILDAKHVAFERGFWSICEAFDGRELTDRMLEPRAWSTVRRLHAGVALEPQLERVLAVTRTSLRSLAVGSWPMLQRVAAFEPALRIEELGLEFDVSRDPPTITGFPGLRRLHVRCLGEFAERWLGRADALGVRELSLSARAHPDYFAKLLRGMKQSRIATLAVEVAPDMTIHALRESDGRITLHWLELGPSTRSPFDAVNNAALWLEGKRALVDRSLKVTLPSFTARVAEYAESLGIKLVRAQKCYPARPRGDR